MWQPLKMLNDFSERDVKTVFETDVARRIDVFPDSECRIEDLSRLRRQWGESGSSVVFSAGVFDILHVSHLLALTHFRLLGAKHFLSARGNLAPALAQLHEVAASDSVRLIVSVDSDLRVAEDKAYVTDKGNCPKPLVSWENRALLLARQYISGLDGSSRPLIDRITRHGAGSCVGRPCPHRDNIALAEVVQPDLIVLSTSSVKGIAKLKHTKTLQATEVIVTDDTQMSYRDQLLGGPVKSSSIIRRARQSSVQSEDLAKLRQK